MAILKSKPEETIAIGDRLDTDILGAVRSDIRSLMVLTGVSNQKDATESPFQPTWIMDNITSIALALKNAHQSTTQ
jgi:4-nitrophenyl phosphatase